MDTRRATEALAVGVGPEIGFTFPCPCQSSACPFLFSPLPLLLPVLSFFAASSAFCLQSPQISSVSGRERLLKGACVPQLLNLRSTASFSIFFLLQFVYTLCFNG